MTEYLVYVGTYTSRGSRGIYRFRFDANSGRLSSLGSETEITNPSFIKLDPKQSFLYAVSEIDNYEGQNSGSVRAYKVDVETGSLTLLNEVSSRGAGPCYLSFDKTGRFLFTANFHGGSIAAFPRLQDGRLGEATAVTQHSGSGLHPVRQKSPHPHAIEVSPDNRFLITADLGLDKLIMRRFDGEKGSIMPDDTSSADLHRGAGPRHFVFHPGGRFIYVVNEIDSTVTAFSFSNNEGCFQELQTISTLPREYSETNDAAGIIISADGSFLYVSNRGHDTIAVFAVDQIRGTLTSVGHYGARGSRPHSIAMNPAGNYLLVANEQSDNIAVFLADRRTGKLTDTGHVVHISSPVCLVFLEK